MDASALASSLPKLLLPKLRPNNLAEAHAESRFGVSLGQQQNSPKIWTSPEDHAISHYDVNALIS